MIEERVPPDFLGVDTPELSFKKEVSIKGECYLTNDALVLHLNITTKADIPCSICNEWVEVGISIPGVYHLEPLETITKGLFDMKEIIRENVLLETPTFAECNKGNCPQRSAIAKYMKPSKLQGPPSEEEGYQPFKDL